MPQATSDSIPRYLTPAGAGRRIGRANASPSTPAGVKAAAAAGRLRVAAVTESGIRLFAPEDVDAFLAANRTPHRRASTSSPTRSAPDATQPHLPPRN